MTTGSSPSGHTVMKPPDPGAMIPGSVHIETMTPATAASTALPPSSATAAPASADSWDPEAILTLRMTRNLVLGGHGPAIGVFVLVVSQRNGVGHELETILSPVGGRPVAALQCSCRPHPLTGWEVSGNQGIVWFPQCHGDDVHTMARFLNSRGDEEPDEARAGVEFSDLWWRSKSSSDHSNVVVHGVSLLRCPGSAGLRRYATGVTVSEVLGGRVFGHLARRRFGVFSVDIDGLADFEVIAEQIHVPVGHPNAPVGRRIVGDAG